MDAQQIKELAERLRNHLMARDGSIYGFERVILNYLQHKKLFVSTDEPVTNGLGEPIHISTHRKHKPTH